MTAGDEERPDERAVGTNGDLGLGGLRAGRLRRMVVSPLDPPFARQASGEAPAVPGPGPVRLNGRPGRPAAPVGAPGGRAAPPAPRRAGSPPGAGHLPPHRPPDRRNGAHHRPRAPARSAWRRAGTTAATGIGLLLSGAFAWFVLVTLRPVRTVTAPIDEMGATVDQTIADTLLAGRVLSVLDWVTSVSTTLVLGGVIFRLFVTRRTDLSWPGTAVGVLRGAALVGMVAKLACVLPRAAEMSGAGLSAAWDLDALRLVLAARFGDAVLVRVAGLAVIAAFSYRRDRPALEWLGFVGGGAAVLASYALVGHPQVTEPAALLVTVQCAHVVAVSTWFGGVTFLAVELRQQRRAGTARASADVVRRFSRTAEVAVGLAAASGVALASSQLDSLAALPATPYGRALLAKLAVLAVPLAIGAYNRQRLVPAIVPRGEAAAWRRLRHTLTLEALVIALGVLVATAAMTSGGF